MTRADDEAVVRDYLNRASALVAHGDADGYLDIWADDGVLEMPFWPLEAGRRHVGRNGIADMLAAMASAANGSADPAPGFDSFAFEDVALRGTDEPGEFVVEMRSEAAGPGGQSYSNRYCGIARVRDGKMVLWREYFDPTRLPT